MASNTNHFNIDSKNPIILLTFEELYNIRQNKFNIPLIEALKENNNKNLFLLNLNNIINILINKKTRIEFDKSKDDLNPFNHNVKLISELIKDLRDTYQLQIKCVISESDINYDKIGSYYENVLKPIEENENNLEDLTELINFERSFNTTVNQEKGQLLQLNVLLKKYALSLFNNNKQAQITFLINVQKDISCIFPVNVFRKTVKYFQTLNRSICFILVANNLMMTILLSLESIRIGKTLLLLLTNNNENKDDYVISLNMYNTEIITNNDINTMKYIYTQIDNLFENINDSFLEFFIICLNKIILNYI